MANFLELQAISRHFGGVVALRNVDLTLRAGEVHCLVGENGSGKSTLIKIISGVLRPEPGGRIVIEGREYPHLNPVQSTANGIQVIYQDLSLFPNLTVAENIAIASHLGAPQMVNWHRLRSTAQAAIARIGASLDIDARVEDLSIANRQLVAICRAMAADARLVIMDEPTASLSRHEVEALVRLVADLKRAGICIVFVSHRLNEVMEIAERVTVLRDGAKVGEFPAAEMDDRKLATLMTGKAFAYRTSATDSNRSEKVLSVRHLSRAGQYHDINLDIRAGEIVGLTGLLGSGRTEFALSLFGMNQPTAGEIRLHDKPLALKTNAQAIEEGIAYVSEDRLNLGLVLEQPISANILITVLGKLTNGFGLVPEARRQRTTRQWIDELAIKAPSPENAVRTLSGGNQQRVVLAKWMATRPKLLILDSPTVGVDIAAKDGIYEVVRALAAQGVAILLISDEIPEVFYHAHRVLVMRRGRLAGECVPHESTEEALQAVVDA
ncbi:sugar ABC transporter ATP-binding protein [Variovorax sp. J2P1-59]|uniref:sugar ABC transporter ATP-binding protein n=1 Tax=Variovorax flavidus TaxID=3053501 RepID=UPI002574DCC0|nr:sugar ABC transporter ATP-binding protein [Variovorax sp. J2P1-59]MDM0078804.1 sugar ABC transporter ATP-binding protein [Variovorax sp. J2P1-59]